MRAVCGSPRRTRAGPVLSRRARLGIIAGRGGHPHQGPGLPGPVPGAVVRIDLRIGGLAGFQGTGGSGPRAASQRQGGSALSAPGGSGPPPGRAGAGGTGVGDAARGAPGVGGGLPGRCHPAVTIFPCSPVGLAVGLGGEDQFVGLAAFPLPNIGPHRPSMTIGWPPGPHNWPRWARVSRL